MRRGWSAPVEVLIERVARRTNIVAESRHELDEVWADVRSS